jgi:hypothetical protein
MNPFLFSFSGFLLKRVCVIRIILNVTRNYEYLRRTDDGVISQNIVVFYWPIEVYLLLSDGI